jgi:hypothetical protein
VGSTAFSRALERAAAKMPPAVLAAARKWAAARKLALSDVMATILLESRGNPGARNFSAKEDSRGAMQVNVHAWGDVLTKLGYRPDDLYDPAKGVEVGTLILRSYRDKVEALVAASRVRQAHPLATLARLYYVGPKYVRDMIGQAKATEQTVRPFKDADVYVDHWDVAKAVAAKAWGA